MDHLKILIVVALVALAWASEDDDLEQKKRGAGKPASLNAIPTGAQKPEFTYSIYSQNQHGQNNLAPSLQYQSQLPSSFYPTQAGAQYYQPEPTSVYPQQPQLNLIPPHSSSQFVPLNFVPTPGYQSKYQLIPSKSANGNIQLAILQPPSYQSPPFVPYQSLFAPQGQSNGQQYSFFNSPQSQLASNYQLQPNLQSLGQQYAGQQYTGQQYSGQPSAMLLVTQPNPGGYNSYNNLLYPNSVPNLYNYYQSPQVKYLYGGGPGGGGAPAQEYERGAPGGGGGGSGGGAAGPAKEDNEISPHSSADYLSQAESNSNYKNYVTGRSAYKN